MFFQIALGFKIIEGYGQTETSATGSNTFTNDPTMDTVGG